MPYLCVGFGAGIFGGNLGTAIRNKAVLKNPQTAKQIDKRNQELEAAKSDIEVGIMQE